MRCALVQGIGLYLCKNLTELMGGELVHDTAYDSGVSGHPGTRFIVKLNHPPVDPLNLSALSLYHMEGLEDGDSSESGSSATGLSINGTDLAEKRTMLPQHLHVLFVDDDSVLRKLFSRKLKTVAPDWTVREAANGETALFLVEEHTFDLIFMDQYMASVEKQVRLTQSAVVPVDLRTLTHSSRLRCCTVARYGDDPSVACQRYRLSNLRSLCQRQGTRISRGRRRRFLHQAFPLRSNGHYERTLSYPSSLAALLFESCSV